MATLTTMTAGDDRDHLKCRFYEEEFPKVDDLVVIRILRIEEMGVYCALLEYNEREGMMSKSEISRRRIRSLNRHVRVGQQDVALVLQVDAAKGYIDLSKKHVIKDEVQPVLDRYHRAKGVHSIMRHLSTKSMDSRKKPKRKQPDAEPGAATESKEGDTAGLIPIPSRPYTVLELYEGFGWPMAREFRSGYEAFQYAYSNWDEFVERFDVPDEIQPILQDVISRRLKPKVVTVQAIIDVKCFSEEGIIAIKRALLAGAQLIDEDCPFEIKFIAPPKYELVVSLLDSELALSRIQQAIDAITESIKESGGSCHMSQPPKLIYNEDDEDLIDEEGEED